MPNFQMKGKKGFSSLPSVISTLVIVATILAVGFFVMQEFMTRDAFFQSTTLTDDNLKLNATGTVVSGFDGERTKNFLLTGIVNATDGEVWLVGNATLGSTTGLLVNATTEVDPTYDVNVTYTFDRGKDSWSGVYTTVEALTIVPNMLGIIILVIMMGIILAVVFNVIPGARVAGA